MTKVNPVAFKGFNRDRSTLRQVPVYNSKTEFASNNYVLAKAKEVALKNPKMVAFGAIATLGAVAGLPLLISKGKVFALNHKANKIQKNSKKIVNQVSSIKENAKVEYETATLYIEDGEVGDFKTVTDEDGNVIRRFIIKDDLSSMQEFSDGKLVKETRFDPTTMDISMILKYVEHVNDTEIKASKGYSYENGELYAFARDIKGNVFNINESDKGIQASELFEFMPDNKFVYKKDSVESSSLNNYKEQYFFMNDKLRTYRKAGQTVSDSETKVGQSLDFDENGKLEEYYKNIHYKYNSAEDLLDKTYKSHYALDDRGRLVKQK